MSHPLSRIPVFGQFVDERFLEHRRRSTSMAGIVAACLAVALFEYRLLRDHVWSWDLFSIAAAFAAVKLAMMFWYRVKD